MKHSRTPVPVFFPAPAKWRLPRFISVNPQSGCWEWTGRKGGQSGYAESPSKPYVYLHRWVLAHKLGRELEPGEQACHTCDNPPCIRPTHLWVGTQSDNFRDAGRKGRNPSQIHAHARFQNQRGVGNYQAKLTDEQVAEIIGRYRAGGVLQRELAVEYGVTQGHISGLVNGTVHAREVAA